jgi:hypothetical protein
MVTLRNEQKLISPTKETYFTDRSLVSKFSQFFKDNTPMYLFDMQLPERNDAVQISKFRDSHARVRSSSPQNKQKSITLADEMNSCECRDAIYESHGIVSGRDSPLKQVGAPPLSARINRNSPIEPYRKERLSKTGRFASLSTCNT